MWKTQIGKKPPADEAENQSIKILQCLKSLIKDITMSYNDLEIKS